MEFNFLIYEWEDRQLSPELTYYPYLMNSDAHSLGLINAPLYYLEVLKGNRLFSDDLKGETK